MAAQNSATYPHEGLRSYLSNLPKDLGGVELSYQQIEVLIGQALPAQAHEFSWWSIRAEESSHHSNSWTQAGFGISMLAKSKDGLGSVTFARGLQRWPGVAVDSCVFGEMAFAERLSELSSGYLESAKLLCVRLGENPDELNWPRGSVVSFCYRHAVELFLKSCITLREPVEKCDHKISNLRRQYLKLYPGKEFRLITDSCG